MPTACIWKRASQCGPSTGGAAVRKSGKGQIRNTHRESWQRQASSLHRTGITTNALEHYKSLNRSSIYLIPNRMLRYGGEGGIRTPYSLATMSDFESGVGS